MRQRGNAQGFLDKLRTNWDGFVNGCLDDTKSKRNIVLQSGEYLGDVWQEITKESKGKQKMENTKIQTKLVEGWAR